MKYDKNFVVAVFCFTIGLGVTAQSKLEAGTGLQQSQIAGPSDLDLDQVADCKDAFPLDAAASEDADYDGLPDRWNSGKSNKDSTTGLELDDRVDISKNQPEILCEMLAMEKKLVAGNINTNFTVAALLKRIDLEYPGLESVKKAYEDKDIETAGNALLAYFRNRYPAPARLESGKVSPDAIHAMRHEFRGNTKDTYLYRGASIDWVSDGFKDVFWMHSFLNMVYWRGMTDAYTKTQNAAFFRELRAQLISYHESMYPFDQDPRSKHDQIIHPFAISIRLETYVQSKFLERFIHDPAFDAKTLAYFLNALYVNMEFMRDHFSGEGNHLLYELSRTLQYGLAFPEFKVARKPVEGWVDDAVNRMQTVIGLQLFPDGMNRELSTHYHPVYADTYRRFYTTGRDHGYAFSSNYMGKMRKSYDAVIGYSLPLKFRRASFGDAWLRYTPTSTFAEYADEDEGYKYLATKGAEGTSPSVQTLLDYSGFYGLRSDWGVKPTDKGIGLIIKNGWKAYFHNQPDNLTFELSAYGRMLMNDAGQSTYNRNATRARFEQSRVHQLVTLDNKNTGFDNARSIRWITNAAINGITYDLVELENNSYENLTHNRTVVMLDRQYFLIVDRLSGSASTGTLRAHFQLANENHEANINPDHYYLNFKDLTAETRFPSGGNLVVKGLAQSGLTMVNDAGVDGAGFLATWIDQEVERPAFAYSLGRVKGQQQFITALVPFEGDNRQGKRTPKVNLNYNKARDSITLTVDSKPYTIPLPKGTAGFTDTDGDGEPNKTDAFHTDPSKK